MVVRRLAIELRLGRRVLLARRGLARLHLVRDVIVLHRGLALERDTRTCRRCRCGLALLEWPRLVVVVVRRLAIELRLGRRVLLARGGLARLHLVGRVRAQRRGGEGLRDLRDAHLATVPLDNNHIPIFDQLILCLIHRNLPIAPQLDGTLHRKR